VPSAFGEVPRKARGIEDNQKEPLEKKKTRRPAGSSLFANETLAQMVSMVLISSNRLGSKNLQRFSS